MRSARVSCHLDQRLVLPVVQSISMQRRRLITTSTPVVLAFSVVCYYPLLKMIRGTTNANTVTH
eukprot:4411974-Prymnesium_polylepis.1